MGEKCYRRLVRDSSKGGRNVGGECSEKMWYVELGGSNVGGKCSGEMTKVRGL